MEDPSTIYTQVQSHYSRAALEPPSNTTTSSSPSLDKNDESTSYASKVALAFNYPPSALISSPAESNLGLSCGNPIALASLRRGETVVDLGCGAGWDVFQAAEKVGGDGEGRVVGVDFNEDMLARAEKIKSRLLAKENAATIDFIRSPITQLPLADATVDAVISNCVINLVPDSDKPTVFKEIGRVLKPGGRVAISDILLKKELPAELKRDVGLWVGCVAGASEVGRYEEWARKEGRLEDVTIVADGSDLNIYKTAKEGAGSEDVGCCGSGVKGKTSCGGSAKAVTETKGDLGDVDLNEWAGSFKIYAVKPMQY